MELAHVIILSAFIIDPLVGLEGLLGLGLGLGLDNMRVIFPEWVDQSVEFVIIVYG